MSTLIKRGLAREIPKISAASSIQSMARDQEHALFVIQSKSQGHVYALIKLDGQWYWTEAAYRRNRPSRPWTVESIASPAEMDRRATGRLRGTYALGSVWEVTGSEMCR